MIWKSYKQILQSECRNFSKIIQVSQQRVWIQSFSCCSVISLLCIGYGVQMWKTFWNKAAVWKNARLSEYFVNGVWEPTVDVLSDACSAELNYNCAVLHLQCSYYYTQEPDAYNDARSWRRWGLKGETHTDTCSLTLTHTWRLQHRPVPLLTSHHCNNHQLYHTTLKVKRGTPACALHMSWYQSGHRTQTLISTNMTGTSTCSWTIQIWATNSSESQHMNGSV